jgi:hypothetical protein
VTIISLYMNNKIPKQTEAEHDQHLIESFIDSNFVSSLTNDGLTVISGRKGAGKTAICRYVSEMPHESGIDFAHRLSVRAAAAENKEELDPHSIIFFILLRTVQELIGNNLFDRKPRKQWQDFLTNNNMAAVKDFGQFLEISRTSSKKVTLNAKAFQGLDLGLEESKNSDFTKVSYSNAVMGLALNIKSSVKKQKIMIFVDDISDHLDLFKKDSIKEGINQVGKILQIFDDINTSVAESKNNYLKFICCIRNDLWEYMEGSNVNKLENNALEIEWSEKSFCELLIKRLAFFEGNIEESLKDPVNSIKKLFPDNIFEERLRASTTKTYHSNFYAYMMAISFNRPRDFLKFCYALRERLPKNGDVAFETIESAEIEYTDYFIKEVKDELYIINEIFSIDQSLEALMKILTPLADRDEFKYGQLRSEINKMLNKGSHSDLRVFIKDLWWYGILGTRRDKTDLLRFRYMPNESSYYPREEEVKDYSFALHRGIMWHLRKRYRSLTRKARNAPKSS